MFQTPSIRLSSECLDDVMEESLLMQAEPENPPPAPICNLVAFFIFVYVIFLSAAADILERDQSIRKSTVLLANILPCLAVKLISPYFVRVIPYGLMVIACTILSIASLVIVAWLDPMWMKFMGIILASASSGLGETAYLALTTYFNPKVVVAWSSGTGAAGIVGAVYYLLFSSILGFTMQTTLMLACILPIVMICCYEFLLTKEHYESIERVEDSSENNPHREESKQKVTPIVVDTSFMTRLSMIRPLLFRYIAPLFLVYYAEYVINQGVFFSLLYPLEKTPFLHYNDHYKTYSALYQTGVFISRTFGRNIPVSNIWIFAIMQFGMLSLLTFEALFMYINQVYVILALVFLEGLLGGAAYVNTFCNITEQVEKSNLEFSMGFTGIADSSGIGLAGFTCLFFEPFLCSHNSICRIIRNP